MKWLTFESGTGEFTPALTDHADKPLRNQRPTEWLSTAREAQEEDMDYTSETLKVTLGLGLVVFGLSSAVSVAGAQTCVEPPSGLVSWWPGDGNAQDIVGENDGTVQNGTTFVDGVVGEAFSFDGVDDFVSAPHNESQNLREALTIDAWIMRQGVCNPLNCIVLMKEDAPAPLEGDLRYGIVLHDDPESGFYGRVSLSLNTGVWADVAISSTVLEENVWYHVAGTYDGSIARIYVNGVLENSVEHPGPLLPSTGGAMKIGQESAAGEPVDPPEFFNGLIDEVELFNRALSAQEIAGLYEAGSAGKCRNAAVVKIDIKPFKKSKAVNPKSRGLLRVAVFGSGEFDATQIDLATVRFGRRGARPVRDGRVTDVNRDGYADMLLLFDNKAIGTRCGDRSIALSGVTFTGQRFSGSDSIRTVGCKKKKKK